MTEPIIGAPQGLVSAWTNPAKLSVEAGDNERPTGVGSQPMEALQSFCRGWLRWPRARPEEGERLVRKHAGIVTLQEQIDNHRGRLECAVRDGVAPNGLSWHRAQLAEDVCARDRLIRREIGARGAALVHVRDAVGAYTGASREEVLAMPTSDLIIHAHRIVARLIERSIPLPPDDRAAIDRYQEEVVSRLGEHLDVLKEKPGFADTSTFQIR